MTKRANSQVAFTLSYTKPDLANAAQSIAKTYGFHLDETQLPRLNLTSEHLELLTPNFKPLFIDFTDPVWHKRAQAGKQQGLIKACKPARGVRILDATAGWGRDAVILAHCGAEVTMLERQPLMAALLADALQRCSSLPLQLIHTDAFSYLEKLSEAEYPDVIYIDPMHPARTKSALVKKDMQILQQLFGPDDAINELIALAVARCHQRVVVKWPSRIPALMPFNQSIDGKTVRFDIYISR